MANEQFKVIAGIDTHADTHHVALITDYGKRLGDRKFLAVGSGYREIAAYLTSFGPVTAVGVEGTGSYGAELSRVLAGQGFTVREVNRPNRAERRIRGKSDSLDAYQAAESVLADRGTSTPKTRDGYVEALRVQHRPHQCDEGPYGPAEPDQRRTHLCNGGGQVQIPWHDQ